jgi:hypothetical protein
MLRDTHNLLGIYMTTRTNDMIIAHSTRPSSVVLCECPEGIRAFPLEVGIARTTDLTAIADPETGSCPIFRVAMHSGSSATCSSQKI